MTKAERLSASRRKKKADPNQQSKTGAAKPTYVSTDKPKKKVNEDVEGRKTALTEPKTKTERLARKKDSEIRREAERSMYDTSAGESEIVKRQRIAKKLRSSTIPKNQEKGGQMEIDTTKKLVGEEFGKMTKEQEDIYVGNKAGRIKFDRITDYKKRQQLKKNLKTYPGDEDHTTTTAEAYSAKPSNLKKKAKLTAMLNRLQDLKVKKKLNEMNQGPSTPVRIDPVKYDPAGNKKPGLKVMPNSGATRVTNVRPKPGFKMNPVTNDPVKEEYKNYDPKNPDPKQVKKQAEQEKNRQKFNDPMGVKNTNIGGQGLDPMDK